MTKYQQAIYDTVGRSSMAVIAVAGSGKTTTAIESLDYCRTSSVLMSAFNVSIRDEFRSRGEARGYKHVKYVNYNGFGWSICLKHLKPTLDADKTSKIMEYRLNLDRKVLLKNRTAVSRAVSLLKAMYITEPAVDDVESVKAEYDLDVDTTLIMETYRECLAEVRYLDFDDQKFMPVYLGLPIPRYDIVFIDEFQDTCELEYILLTSAGEQVVALGDPDQTIYSFKAARVDTFDKFIAERNAVTRGLNVCYRCSEAVIEEAQRIVPRIEAAPGAIRGSVKNVKDLSGVGSGDFVLCRTNSPLVDACISLLRRGVPCFIKGRDFGTGLAALIETVGGVGEGLEKRLLAYRDKMVMTLSNAERICDRVESILALMELGGDLLGTIKSMFSETGRGVCLMSIHKSKGLQAKNVFLLKTAPVKGDPAEERRLQYVAITRAQENFYYVG